MDNLPTQEIKPGHRTTELGLSLASIVAMLKIGLDSRDPNMQYIAMGGTALIAVVYIWSRTRLKMA